MKYISTKSEMLLNPHFAVLIFTTTYIPGDTRSRNYPGHGYPAHTDPVVKYIAFKNEEELTEWITKQKIDNFVVIESAPKTVTIKPIITYS